MRVLRHVESVPIGPFPDGPVDAVGRLASLRVHRGAQQLASDVVGGCEQAGIGLRHAVVEPHVVVRLDPAVVIAVNHDPGDLFREIQSGRVVGAVLEEERVAGAQDRLYVFVGMYPALSYRQCGLHVVAAPDEQGRPRVRFGEIRQAVADFQADEGQHHVADVQRDTHVAVPVDLAGIPGRLRVLVDERGVRDVDVEAEERHDQRDRALVRYEIQKRLLLHETRTAMGVEVGVLEPFHEPVARLGERFDLRRVQCATDDQVAVLLEGTALGYGQGRGMHGAVRGA